MAIVKYDGVLLPCPFCGSADIVIKRGKTFCVECNACGAFIIRCPRILSGEAPIREAVEAWNKRAAPCFTVKRDRFEDYREALRQGKRLAYYSKVLEKWILCTDQKPDREFTKGREYKIVEPDVTVDAVFDYYPQGIINSEMLPIPERIKVRLTKPAMVGCWTAKVVVDEDE